MKKIRGSALLWCLAVLMVLSIITLTAVGLSVSYYRSCVKRAGDNQAEYNSVSAAEMIRSQLESRFGGKQIYFAFRGGSMLDVSDPERVVTVTAADRGYFGSVLDSAETERDFCAVRRLENELITDYVRNSGGDRVPVRLTYNYGRTDPSVWSHGYYSDSADIMIDSMERIDEGDGKNVRYAAVVKAVSEVSTGHKAAVGARFISSPVPFDSEGFPAAVCSVLRLGISPETVMITDSETLDDIDVLKYGNANGVILGLEQDQCVLIYGDSVAGPQNEAYDAIKEAESFGFIRTDGYIENGVLTNEISYLAPDAFRIADGTAGSAVSRYEELHRAGAQTFTADYPAYRGAGDRSLEPDRIFSDDGLKSLKAYYSLPAAAGAGDRTNNRAKRYYVVSGSSDPYCHYTDINGEREYSMGFVQYVSAYKSGASLPGDHFEDKYNTEEGLICCTVERRDGAGAVTDTDSEIRLDGITLENGMTYFFDIKQSTRISFSRECYDPSVSADVYFRISCDTGGEEYRIDLTLENPPRNMRFFAFDRGGGQAYEGPVKPESAVKLTHSGQSDLTRNVKVIVKDTAEYTVPADYTVSGWFSCYSLSVYDETERTDEDVGRLAAGEKILPRRVTLRGIRPPRFITVSDGAGSALSGDPKCYTWTFDRFVPAE